MAVDRGLLDKALNIINNVGNYGPLDATIDSYKQAADYADDARKYAELAESGVNDINTQILKVTALTDKVEKLEIEVNESFDKITSVDVDAVQGENIEAVYNKEENKIHFTIPKGKDGINGINGKDGTNGVNGKSAYELAVSAGYTGSLQDFNDMNTKSLDKSKNLSDLASGPSARTNLSVYSKAEIASLLTAKAGNGANTDITSLNGLTTAITIAQGGTGSKNAAGARANLDLLSKTDFSKNDGYKYLGQVTSFADLRTLTPTEDGIIVRLKGWNSGSTLGGGLFVGSLSAKTDDGGVTASNGGSYNWTRIGFEYVTPEMFGALGDGVTDDTAAIQKMLNSSVLEARFSDRTYATKNGFDITVAGKVLSGSGAKIYYPKTTASYYHCLRVGANDVTIKDLYIYSDASLVRDDTGFGISIGPFSYTTISNVTLENIASAAIWATKSVNTSILNVKVKSAKADGIHFSDGCRNFVVSDCLISNCKDDCIAVVSDIAGDGFTPQYGVISNNLITDSSAGHGTVLIGCNGVNVVGNTYRNLEGPAIGSYFWHVTGTPLDEDWSRDCKISDNLISSCGTKPVNVNNATSIYVGALKNSTISGNRISGAPANSALGTPGSCIQISNALNLGIYDNILHDSSDHGICCLDSNASGKASFSGIWVSDNKFEYIEKDSLHFYPTSNEIGEVSFTGNHLIHSPNNASFTRSMYVGKTLTNKLVIANNFNHHSTVDYSYDAATCTNVFTSGNTPAIGVTWTPVAAPISGSWTTSAKSGKYYQIGSTIFFTATITVTDKGTGSGCNLTLPKTARSGSYPVQISGRENGVSGKTITGILSSPTVSQIVFYDNTDPVSNGSSLIITGSYQTIS